MTLTTDYLSSLLPPMVNQLSGYNLRNISDYRMPLRFRKSFLPSSIKAWNNLDEALKSIHTPNCFKNRLKDKYFAKTNKLLLYGSNHGSINQARMRMGLSGLNKQRRKYHFILHSNCPVCGNRNEDVTHYFLHCQHYAALREDLYRGIANVLAPNVNPNLIVPQNKQDCKYFIQIILHGSNDLSYADNCILFDCVHSFITDTGRFN